MKKLWILVCIALMSMTLIGCSSKKEDVQNEVKEPETTQGTTENKDNAETKEESTDKEAANKYPMTIETSGGSVTIDEEPQSVISLGPNITEIIYAVGAGDKLVGRTQYCNYPEQVKDVAEIGTLTDPSIENIVEINPDLVIASTHVTDKVLKKLNDVGIKTIQLYEMASIDGALNMVETIGTALNKDEETKALLEDANKRLEAVKEQTKDVERPTVYYVVGYGEAGEFTATGETFINEIINVAGGNNVAKDTTGWSYSIEKLIEDNPEYIFIAPYLAEGFKTTEPYSSLDAVKNNKVITVDEDIYQRQGPRVIDAIEDMANILQNK